MAENRFLSNGFEWIREKKLSISCKKVCFFVFGINPKGYEKLIKVQKDLLYYFKKIKIILISWFIKYSGRNYKNSFDSGVTIALRIDKFPVFIRILTRHLLFNHKFHHCVIFQGVKLLYSLMKCTGFWPSERGDIDLFITQFPKVL